MRIVLCYLLIINILTIVIYGIDKWKSKRNYWRIPESVLLLLALVGGSVGALLGMALWRHKTQHAKFKYGVPLILLLQVAVVVFLALKY